MNNPESLAVWSPWTGMTGDLSSYLRWQVAAFSGGAAAIHFAAIPPHIKEWWLFGAFFFVVGWFQVGSAVAVVARLDRRLIVAIAIVNAVVILIWIWSRTAGLPIGPEAGEPEAVGAADFLSTVLEALLVSWAVGLLSPRFATKPAAREVGLLTTVAVWIVVLAMTAVVLFANNSEAGHAEVTGGSPPVEQPPEEGHT